MTREKTYHTSIHITERPPTLCCTESHVARCARPRAAGLLRCGHTAEAEDAGRRWGVNKVTRSQEEVRSYLMHLYTYLRMSRSPMGYSAPLWVTPLRPRCGSRGCARRGRGRRRRGRRQCLARPWRGIGRSRRGLRGRRGRAWRARAERLSPRADMSSETWRGQETNTNFMDENTYAHCTALSGHLRRASGGTRRERPSLSLWCAFWLSMLSVPRPRRLAPRRWQGFHAG